MQQKQPPPNHTWNPLPSVSMFTTTLYAIFSNGAPSTPSQFSIFTWDPFFAVCPLCKLFSPFMESLNARASNTLINPLITNVTEVSEFFIDSFSSVNSYFVRFAACKRLDTTFCSIHKLKGWRQFPSCWSCFDFDDDWPQTVMPLFCFR